MKRYCIINNTQIAVINRLQHYGYECIATEKSTDVSQPISLHADVLYLKTDNKLFVSQCQTKNIKYLESLKFKIETVKLAPGYKFECKLNMVYSDDLIICNPKTGLNLQYCDINKKIISVNQGYTKCSTIVLKNNLFITEDNSIYNSLVKSGFECLLLEKGEVALEGYDYGFIGGASVYLEDENILLFLGDITKHKDYDKIYNYCRNNKIEIDYISDMKLCDIGGAVICKT